MKKRKTVMLTAIFAMLIAGCGNNGSDSVSVSSKSDDPVTTDNTVVSDDPVSDDSEEVIASDSEDVVISDTVSDIIVDSDSTSEYDPYDTKWTHDAVDEMLKHLGNQTIPYINLGRAIDASYNQKTYQLTISGTNEVDYRKCQDFVEAYTKDGYTCTDVDETSDTVTAVNSDKHLTVVLKNDTYGYGQLLVTYDEPFDAENASGSWNDEITEAFNDNLDKHILPYVYLGTNENYYLIWNATSNIYTIRGQKWDNSIVEAAKKAFTEDDGWSTTEKTTSDGRPDLLFVKTYDDGCKFSIALSSTKVTGFDGYFANFVITYTEVFTPSAASEWNDDVKAEFDIIDNHDLTYVYLGTKNPIVKSSSGSTIQVTGGYWNKEVINTAKGQLDADGWETYVGTNLYGEAIHAYKTFDDGCTLYVVIGSDSTPTTANAKILMKVSRFAKLTVPESETDWDEDTKTAFKTYLKTDDIPFSYIGKISKINYASSSRLLTITGEKYNAAMLPLLNSALTAANWETTITTDNYGRVLKATKKTNDGTLSLTLNSCSTPGTSLASIALSFKEDYEAPSDGSWDETLATKISKALLGYSFPYVYLGTTSPTTTSTDTVINGGKIVINGGEWNDNIVDVFKEALEKDSLTWTFTDDGVTTNSYTAEAYDESGNHYIATLAYNTSKMATLTLRIKTPYKAGAVTSWTDDETTKMNTVLNNHASDVPFVYLGSASLTTTTSTTITGIAGQISFTAMDYATYTTEILDDAEKTYKEAGWTTQTVSTTYGEALQGYKKFDDGYTLRFQLRKSANNDYAQAKMIINMDEPFADSKADDYSWGMTAANQTKFDTVIGSTEVPTLFLGTGSTVTATSTTGSGNNYVTLKGAYPKNSTTTKLNAGYSVMAYDDLVAAGYDTEISYFDNTGNFPSVKGTKIIGDKKVTIYYTAASSGISAIYAVDKLYTPTEETAWDLATVNGMESHFDGHVIPFFDMGADHCKATFSMTGSTDTMTMTGGIYDDAIFTSAENALKADTELTWAISYTYAYTSTIGVSKTLVACATDPTTGRTLAITLSYTTANYVLTKVMKLTVVYY